MANQYDTNLKLQAIADAIGDSSSSGLISALEDIADAVAGGGGGGSSTAGLVSDNFSETDTYDMGDYCIHNNTMYVCINAITTPGPWDLSDWQATNAGLELSSLNSALANIGERVHSEGYTPYTVQNGGTINQITIPKDGTYIFTSYIRGGSCWFTKNGAIYPDIIIASADTTSYSAIWTLNAGDVIAQSNQTGSAQTYTASEMSAIRIK